MQALAERQLADEAPASRTHLIVCSFLAGVLVMAVAADASSASPSWPQVAPRLLPPRPMHCMLGRCLQPHTWLPQAISAVAQCGSAAPSGGFPVSNFRSRWHAASAIGCLSALMSIRADVFSL